MREMSEIGCLLIAVAYISKEYKCEYFLLLKEVLIWYLALLRFVVSLQDYLEITKNGAPKGFGQKSYKFVLNLARWYCWIRFGA